MSNIAAPDALSLSPVPASELARLDARFPTRNVAVGGGAVVSVRECGKGPVVVCLHGIGSGAASWIDTAELLASQARFIAWDAPGYGESTPLESASPSAADYAARLSALLDALDIDTCVLAGHSLGAIVAASAALRDTRIRRLVLVSPAIGYGAPSRAQARAKVRTERLAALDELDGLGFAGMAARRAGRLVSDNASEHARQWVRWNMARLNDRGYRQAVELLCNADLLADLPPSMPVRVACGALDVVTPPSACEEVARRCGVPLELVDDAGHAGYVEQPQAVATLLRESLAG
jgi:pimeloyl-ACP methyl ester carboxylesterase